MAMDAQALDRDSLDDNNNEERIQKALSALDREFGSFLTEFPSLDSLLADELFRKSAPRLLKKILRYVSEDVQSRRVSAPESYIWTVLPRLAQNDLPECLALITELKAYLTFKKGGVALVSVSAPVASSPVRLRVGAVSSSDDMHGEDVDGEDMDEEVAVGATCSDSGDQKDSERGGKADFDAMLLWFTQQDRQKKGGVFDLPASLFLFQAGVASLLEGQEVGEMNLVDLISFVLEANLTDEQKYRYLVSFRTFVQSGQLELSGMHPVLKAACNAVHEAAMAV